MFQNEYLIFEILFSLNKDEKLNEKYEKIKNEIATNGFGNAALIYSISDSSSNDGKLGWINENSLSSKIKQQILNIQLGGITRPIIIPGGFLILKIQDKRKTKIKKDINEELDLITKSLANKQLNQFSNIYFNKIKKEVQVNEF